MEIDGLAEEECELPEIYYFSVEKNSESDVDASPIIDPVTPVNPDIHIHKEKKRRLLGRMYRYAIMLNPKNSNTLLRRLRLSCRRPTV